jgi:hypothetical protein
MALGFFSRFCVVISILMHINGGNVAALLTSGSTPPVAHHVADGGEDKNNHCGKPKYVESEAAAKKQDG